MPTLRRLLVAVLVLLLSAAARSEPVSPVVRAEVDALLAKLSSSGCKFNRNGSWHSAAEAKSHLLGKLQYLERKRLVQSTEQFIERGASGSSVSGKPYLVKCGGDAPIESKNWLSAELKALRASAKVHAATNN
jgi:uncharacterized protein DUF5329